MTEESVEGRLRRYYRLTDHGAAALQSEVERLRANASPAAALLRPSALPGCGPLVAAVTAVALPVVTFTPLGQDATTWWLD